MRLKNKRKCRFCRKKFIPDPRVKRHQKFCFKVECQEKRIIRSQENWLRKNPGYFQGRYENTRIWREKNPTYQKEWRKKLLEIQDVMSQKRQQKPIFPKENVLEIQDVMADFDTS